MRRFPTTRIRLTYATAMSMITIVVLLIGGAAYAANQLGKNSVGAKQLKAKSVAATKIKKNAVTNGKIKKNAVTGAKIKDGSLTAANLELAAMPFGHIVARIQGNASIPIGPGATEYPLENPTYTQEAGRTDWYLGAVDFTFAPSCENGSGAAYLLVDLPVGTPELSEFDVAAMAQVDRPGTAQVTKRAHFQQFARAAGSSAPAAPLLHSMRIVFGGNCEVGSGVSATHAEIDVIGTR
ncbi:MAG TPA: hypothetical protein VIT85_02050 [Solirubrobacterales bacterium]